MLEITIRTDGLNGRERREKALAAMRQAALEMQKYEADSLFWEAENMDFYPVDPDHVKQGSFAEVEIRNDALPLH